MRGAGLWIFGLAIAGIGVLSLLSGHFAMYWQPVPSDIPYRAALAYASGAILLVCGLGLLVKRLAPLAAAVLTVDFLVWLVVLRFPQMTSILDSGTWLGIGETACLVVGAGAILAMFGLDKRGGPLGLHLARLLFGVAAILIGQSHLVFAKVTAGYVPGYLPAHYAFAYFTGAAHIAAGIAILVSVAPELAATMEGVMMLLFGLMVWAPRVVATPMSRLDWTAMLVSFAYGAAGLIVAESYRRHPVLSPWRKAKAAA